MLHSHCLSLDCAGINVTAELGPTIDFLVQNIAKLEQWANSSILFSFSVVSELMSYFDDSSPNGQLLNAYPGSRVFSMVGASTVRGWLCC